MGYFLQRGYKDEDYLTDEEWEVHTILEKAGYVFDPSKIDLRLFVPTAILYGVYHRAILITPNREFDVATLTLRQFGAALRRVWPMEDSIDEYRVQRRWHGKKCWGLLGIRGPEVIVSRDFVGRPSNATVPIDPATL